MTTTATRLIVNGIVQGVGFRPSVYRVANKLGLSGWVKNTSSGVEIVISTINPSQFIHELGNELSPLALIESISSEEFLIPVHINTFRILDSIASETNHTQIVVDSKICTDCLTELFEPQSRYYHYPFISCTNCGPRYSIINNLPYDRSTTTYQEFPLCNSCTLEYANPANRRYHAETTCCNDCGPQFECNLETVASYIRDGKIVAIKGTGGYVLITNARNHEAVTRLRERKQRKSKPLAVMALNTISIRRYYARVNAREAELLESNASPIVILQQKNNNAIPDNIAPQLNTLGIMLPHSPLYFLLFYYLLGKPEGYSWLESSNKQLLIVTSANLSDNAIIGDNKQAKNSLANIADHIIGHNRQISMTVDDSIIQQSGNQQVILRRARGLVPQIYHFHYDLPQVFATGATLKSTMCFTRKTKAYLTQYAGDLANVPVIDYYQQIYEHYQHIFNFKPELIVCDLHPDFYTSDLAATLGKPVVRLQHHQAHLCSVIAAHESNGYLIEDKIFGCILDGYGYGENGAALGGELIKFERDILTFKTVSQLPALMLPGGDLAERQPWRIALSMCTAYGLDIPDYLIQQPGTNFIVNMLQKQQFPVTTALGRVFSGVAALLGITQVNDYEAHAAMLLESLVTSPVTDFDHIRLDKDGKPDLALLIKQVYILGVIKKDLIQAVNLFYGSLAALLDKWLVYHASLYNIRQIAASGGCWQSRYLLSLISDKFRHSGLQLLVPHKVPLNDEAISLGQAWYGAKLILNGR